MKQRLDVRLAVGKLSVSTQQTPSHIQLRQATALGLEACQTRLTHTHTSFGLTDGLSLWPHLFYTVLLPFVHVKWLPSFVCRQAIALVL